MPEISDQECREMAGLHQGASPGESGVFKLSDYPRLDGRGDKWPHRMVGERDNSRIQERVIARINKVSELVIDCSKYSLGKAGGSQTKSFQTVSAHVDVGDSHHLLELERRMDNTDGWEADLAGDVLDACLSLARKHELRIAKAPLYGMDSELAIPDRRRRLVEEGFAYALLLAPEDRFARVVEPLDRSQDISEAIAVEHLFRVYAPAWVADGVDVLEVRDLREDKTAASTPRRGIPEFLAKTSVNGNPVHFVVRPAPAPSMGSRERREAVGQLMCRASELLRAGPAHALRANEFHHPHDDSYYAVLRMVSYGRNLEA